MKVNDLIIYIEMMMKTMTMLEGTRIRVQLNFMPHSHECVCINSVEVLRDGGGDR